MAASSPDVFDRVIDGIVEPILDALIASWRYAFTFTVFRLTAIGVMIVAAAFAMDRLYGPKHGTLLSFLPLLPLFLVVVPFGTAYFVRNLGRFIRAADCERRGKPVEAGNIPRHPRGMFAASLNEVWPHSEADAIWKSAVAEADANVDSVGLTFGLPALIVVLGLMVSFAVGVAALAVSVAIAGGVAYLGRRRITHVRAEICRSRVQDWKASRSPADDS